MPTFKTVEDALAFRDSFTQKKLTRIPQYRQITDGKLESLASLKEVMAADYQKAFVPYQTGIVAQTLYDMTNIMASNQSELRYKARSTEAAVITKVQAHEHGHEALDPLLFPISVRRRMYSFLADSYTVVALDITPKPGLLAGFADRGKLQKYAEDDESDSESMTPEASYKRAYGSTNKDRTSTERHEDAYTKATREAMIADGIGVRVRVIDPMDFRGFQVDDDPARFAIGIEYGEKQLNPLLTAFSDMGLRKGSDGCLYIGGDSTPESPSYQALSSQTDADSSTGVRNRDGADEYVKYTQIRTCEETVIVIEHPTKAKADNKGIMIKVPNLFGGVSTGYYLIEGDIKLRSGDLEDRYDPPLRNLMNEAQHYSIARTGWEAMAMAEMTRGVYQLDRSDASEAIEPFDSTQETKAATPEDGRPLPLASGEVKRIEGFGQKVEALLEHAREMTDAARPTDIWGGTGSSGETGIAIARRETALLTKLTPYQTNVATVCKMIHMDVDRYVAESDEPIVMAYLPPEAVSSTKPEVREITKESASLPMDMDYEIGSDTPESKAAREQMSSQRMALGVYGITDHREEIGIKDPTAVRLRLAKDRLMQMLYGAPGEPGIIDEAFRPTVLAYGKAALEREFGPKPQPPMILGPDGMPLAPSAPAGPQGISPERTAPPQGALQSLPEVNNIPVAPGGFPGSA